MNESIIPVTPGLLSLLSGKNTGIEPFKQEIFILEVVIAGTSYCESIETVESLIIPEKVLTMKRQPDNKYDKFAIAIYCENIRIGFVPADMNLVCSRLMDAGKLFFCRVVSKEWKNDWLKIKANIYMVE
ncbi:MAG: HIRAN domain-containing protein [Candidatus Cloacimonetes bacterium]|nr:HIRAN domain-containing protein [Candidatus Cloacimonadota bacterium]